MGEIVRHEKKISMKVENYDDDEPEPPTGWQWLGGCCIGAALGAVGAPLAFLLLLCVIGFFTPDDNAEGSPLWILLCVPLGAIMGAIGFPMARLIFVLLRAKIRRRRTNRR